MYEAQVVAGTYTRTPQDVLDLWFRRRKDRSPIISQMAAVRDLYQGDVVVPLPELDKNEKSFVANLLQQGLDQHAMRIASVMPNLTCPPGDQRRPRSVERAQTRRMATLSWWEANKVPRLMRRRARHLIGYSTSPVMVRPDFAKGIPCWQVRNPLDTFPAETTNPDDLCPTDTIYAVLRTYGWLRSNYPQQWDTMNPRRHCADDEKVTVLEYEDAEQCMILAVGAIGQFGAGAVMAVLEQVPNRAGIPLSVIPGRITLDRLMGQFDGILGMHQMQAKLMAMEVLAVQQGIFPTTYLVQRPNEVATIEGGVIKPGWTGEVNVVSGGDLHETTANPAYAALQTVDRMERGIRVGAGIPADFSGESSTNVRTGRRGDSILSATVDFAVQESQETLAYSLEEENRVATKIAKAYFGNTPRSFHVGWRGAKGHVTYTPNKDFDSDYTQVQYASPGSDMNDLVVTAGQMIGVGLMSQETGRKIIPMIDDPDFEGDKVTSEALEKAMLEGLQQQAAAGQISPPDVARIKQLLREGNLDLADAVVKAHEEAQKRQATVTSEGAPDAALPGSPEAQPGLAVPGAGAEAGVAIGQPPTALGNLDQLLMQMRGTGSGA